MYIRGKHTKINHMWFDCYVVQLECINFSVLKRFGTCCRTLNEKQLNEIWSSVILLFTALLFQL